MCATYRDKQKRAHFESFANKIYTGIREINPEYAEKRAIWELFQNALDTVNNNGVIEIAKTEKGLLFKHNGRPFKDDEFGGLIKQYSVGKKYGENNEQLGQYGTGFISTHVYGKKIIINGSIQTDDGSYRTLKNFELDRDAISPEKLTDKLLEQDEFIESLCDNSESAVTEAIPYTTFEYLASDSNKIRIAEMLNYVESILPYIFCFNDKLTVVKLLSGESEKVYKRGESSDAELNIEINGALKKIPYLSNKDQDVRVIIGSENQSLNDIPKQFLFYPLIETINVGYNFIIHANDFKPNKERDYLHKDSAKEELKTDVGKNQELIKVAFELVLEKVKDEEAISIIDIAKIEFTSSDSNFERKLKTDYIYEIKWLKRLDINDEKYTLTEIEYFDESVLSLLAETRESIYKLLSQFRSLPPFEHYCMLSKHVNNWNDFVDNRFNVLSLSGIGDIIVSECGGNYDYIQDKTSFQTFISQIKEDIPLLNSLPLIPNMHGNFKTFDKLVKWETKELELIKIADYINSSISEKYIHSDFENLENVNSYNREKFKDDFSKYCNELTDSISKEKGIIKPTSVKFLMLTNSLTSFISLNKKTQLNIDISKFYERVLNLHLEPTELTDPTVDTNYQPAIKLLANLYIHSLDENKIACYVLDLKEVLAIMYKNANLKEELLHKLVCIPNQSFVLKSQAELKRDYVKDNDFKNSYDTITHNEIRNEIAEEGFEEFLQHSGSVSGHYLGDKIETTLNKDRNFIPVDSVIIDTVLKLIEKISAKPKTWGQWLPNIDKVKEEILMYKFQNEKTRASLFSILTKSEKTIELLGDLAQIDNLEDLIIKGKQALQEIEQKKSDFQFKLTIGKNIETLIKEKIGKELEGLSVEVKDVQNGQDIVVKVDKKDIYYIEVKSRWSSSSSITMSKPQYSNAAVNKEKYSLCCVDMVDYKVNDPARYKAADVSDIIDRISFINNIGEKCEPLITGVLASTDTENEITITGDYRATIPQKIIREGGKLNEFITFLITRLKPAADHAK